MSYLARVIQLPQESFFLFGPRGTGKSTWLRTNFPEALVIDLLQPEMLRAYSAYPERLKLLIDAHPEKKTVIIDEVQKVPEILSLVHAIIEEKRGIQFILTGSSARKLRRTGVDLLAGRALLKKMHPFLAVELGAAFDLDKALKIGMLPLVWNAAHGEKVLETYAGLYLKEEVQDEGIVRRLGDFARFLEVISFSHGEVINITNIGRECEIGRKVVESYLGILDDLMLGYTLPVFRQRAQRSLAMHPKFYFFDAGIYRSLRGVGVADRSEEVEGHGLEGLVLQHLKAWIDEQSGRWQCAFWRTRTGVEVDFIVYGPTGFWAIEVKNSRKIAPGDLNGLKAFCEEHPKCRPILLYRGKERLLQNGVMCIPCDEFLRSIHPQRNLAEY